MDEKFYAVWVNLSDESTFLRGYKSSKEFLAHRRNLPDHKYLFGSNDFQLAKEVFQKSEGILNYVPPTSTTPEKRPSELFSESVTLFKKITEDLEAEGKLYRHENPNDESNFF